MNKIWTEEALKNFEGEIAELFNLGKIKAPVHLSNGNEKDLIEIFKEIEIRLCMSSFSSEICALEAKKPGDN